MTDKGNSGDKGLFAEERKGKLVDYIGLHRRVTVPELCREFAVSSATIRNDLRELDEAGLITRTHGGAIKKTRTGHEPVIESRVSRNLSAKAAVAAAALSCIRDGDTIVLDAGTTTAELARLLGSRKNITVVTNDLAIASILEPVESVEILLTGGLLRKGFHCTVDHGMNAFLSTLSVDKALMGANSFSLARGASTPDMAQAEMKRKMIAMATQVILLCDHTKLETNSFINFASGSQVDLLVTDEIPEELRRQYEDAEIPVLTPEDLSGE